MAVFRILSSGLMYSAKDIRQESETVKTRSDRSDILSADEKYGQADGVYRGLKLLDDTGVLARIIPELTLGKGMEQRADFHKYDVLEHSLRACAYADKRVRLACLLHDVGKPLCALRDGNSYAHPQEGAMLTKTILQRLKAPRNILYQSNYLGQTSP